MLIIFLLLMLLAIALSFIGLGVAAVWASKISSHVPSEVEQPQQTVIKVYRWDFPVQSTLIERFAPVRFLLNLPVSRKNYYHYRRHTPRNLNPHQFDSYVTPSAPEVRQLSEKLIELGQNRGYKTFELLCFTLAFVQQGIVYMPDVSSETGQIIEYPKYPVETLMDQSGDCEDQVILMAALLKNMDFEVALIILPTHVALGVAEIDCPQGVALVSPFTKRSYYYTETTVTGWLPGQVPCDFQDEVTKGLFEILPV